MLYPLRVPTPESISVGSINVGYWFFLDSLSLEAKTESDGMSNHPPNSCNRGVVEAYPMMMEESAASGGMTYGYDDNTMQNEGMGDDRGGYDNGQYYQQQHAIDNSNALDQSSVSTPRTAGGIGSRRRRSSAASSSYADDEMLNRSERSRLSRSIYEDAQSRALSGTGGILYHGGGMSTARRPLHEPLPPRMLPPPRSQGSYSGPGRRHKPPLSGVSL